MLRLAEQLARAAHAGQIEKLTGHAYVQHLERVVALVEGDDAKAVAWLHDVLEDTPTTIADLLAAGVPEPIVDAVRVLTRTRPHVYAGQPGDKYRDYIRTVRDEDNALALSVKIADLRDHLRPMDPDVLPASMRRRYESALRTLEG